MLTEKLSKKIPSVLAPGEFFCYTDTVFDALARYEKQTLSTFNGKPV